MIIKEFNNTEHNFKIDNFFNKNIYNIYKTRTFVFISEHNYEKLSPKIKEESILLSDDKSAEEIFKEKLTFINYNQNNKNKTLAVKNLIEQYAKNVKTTVNFLKD